MIRKNGQNKYVIDYGAILQMVVIIGVIISVFYHRIGQIEMQIVSNSIKLQNCETRIFDNTKHITKIADEFHEHEVNDK